MKTLLAALLFVVAVPSFAQTAPASSTPAAATSNATTTLNTAAQLMQWVATQQANVGMGMDWNGVKYVTTSWDLLSLGSSGINVAAAGSKDYFDLGPMTSAANAEKTRYGALPLIHFGNIWDAIGAHLPASIISHVNLASLPDVALGIGVFEPTNGVLKSWRWKKDTQGVLVYRFGGTTN